MKISVIIPIYNVEKYLQKCLDSLVNQPNVEIVCINDGSTDTSGMILEQYGERIKVLTTQNLGVSSARNLGIRHSTGDYITFVDADDWVEDGCFAVVEEKLKAYNPDLLIFNYREYRQAQVIENKYYNFLEKYVNTLFEVTQDTFYFPLTTWGKVVKKEFIQNTEFNPKLCCTEDKVFWDEILLKKPKVYVTDEIFYNYNRRENSLTADSKTALTNLFRTIAVLQDSEFYKNAPITLQAVMLDWMLPEVQVYWVNCYGFEKEISSLMDSFNRFDKSILSQLKIYPLFKKIVFISRCPFLKFFYLKLLNIPQPVLKKLKRIAMR